jgi:4-hydroxybenzoate polyprenyltransferase
MEGIRVLSKLRRYGELVMFSHSIFSFSFTVLAALTAARGVPALSTAVLVVFAFLGGRTCANALNRIIDRKIDAQNPRTSNRHIPSGSVNVTEAFAVSAASFAVMAFSSFLLNPICVALLPVAGILFIFYSFTKRFTWLCHGVLGVVCAGASVGAWIAVRGGIDWPVLLLASANAAWVAGFDIVYAIQDIAFDRKAGLHSIPARFGAKGALAAAASAHAFAVASLSIFGLAVGLGVAYYTTVAIIAFVLVLAWFRAFIDYERNTAFASYSANQVVSVVLLAGTAVEFGVAKTIPAWMSIHDAYGLLLGAMK